MKARPSLTHPLQVGRVDVPGGGRLGLTFCPGKKQPDAVTGAWDRDLDLDLDSVASHGPAAFLCLMEEGELERVSVPLPALEQGVESRGIEFLHLPIPDVSVPGPGFERNWVAASTRLRAHLRVGGTVVVHCKGGLGRTGTIAARLLVECGLPAEEAVTRVRAARPGAIETREQESFVRSLAPGSPDPGSPTARERIVGCLLAGAIGDAFGFPIEFRSLADIREKYGPRGLREPVLLENGLALVTDDTQMTLFTAEGLLRAAVRSEAKGICHPPSIVHRAYLRWLRTQGGRPAGEFGDILDGWLIGVRELWELRAPGHTCMTALASGRMGTPEEPLNDSKGCGTVMRIAPAGLISHDPGTAFHLGCQIGAITHGHPTGWIASGALAAMVAWLLRGVDVRAALEGALEFLEPVEGSGETIDALVAAERLAAEGTPTPERLETLGGGWVAEQALAIAVYSVLAERDPLEAMRLAVNHSGDSDSTGAIAGNLLGAWLGPGFLPPRWIRRLELRDTLLEIAWDLADLREESLDLLSEKTWSRYPGH